MRREERIRKGTATEHRLGLLFAADISQRSQSVRAINSGYGTCREAYLKTVAAKRFLALSICLAIHWAGPGNVSAATIVATSPSFSSVSAAVSTAQPGDTVQVPAGSATWSSTLMMTRPITLVGAGIGNTVISSGIGDHFSGLIKFVPSDPNSNPSFRVTGFTFNGGWNSSGIVISNGTATNINRIRIDHNNFNNFIQYAIKWDGEVYGLLDHNQFVDNYLCTQILGRDWYSWEGFPLQPGTANYPYLEDNTYTYTGDRTDVAFIVEAGQGSRFVFRHNVVDVQSSALRGVLELFDAHGNQDPVTPAYRPNGSRGTIGVEIYDNRVSVLANHRILNLRGGAAKMFNNVVTQASGAGSDINMTEYDGWSYHFLSAWPGYDPVQDAFFWNNSINGAALVPKLFDPVLDPVFIQENRDWFRPSFGLNSARPTACSDNTYYAATDTEVLYKCHPQNTWNAQYAAYQYPHPLASGAFAAPQTPTGLRIQR